MSASYIYRIYIEGFKSQKLQNFQQLNQVFPTVYQVSNSQYGPSTLVPDLELSTIAYLRYLPRYFILEQKDTTF